MRIFVVPTKEEVTKFYCVKKVEIFSKILLSWFSKNSIVKSPSLFLLVSLRSYHINIHSVFNAIQRNLMQLALYCKCSNYLNFFCFYTLYCATSFNHNILIIISPFLKLLVVWKSKKKCYIRSSTRLMKSLFKHISTCNGIKKIVKNIWLLWFKAKCF